MTKIEFDTKTAGSAEMLAVLKEPEFVIDSGEFKGKSVVSSEQFTPAAIGQLMEVTRQIEKMQAKELLEILPGWRAAVLFYEPSSRTYSSFMFAAMGLGMNTVGYLGMVDISSVSKGETIADTVKIFGGYSHVLIMRHPEKTAALEAALNSPVPVINGGSGTFEHPTQALLDYYTILKETKFRDPRSLHYCFVGDLAKGRTVHSLTKLLAKMGAGRDGSYFSFVSPEVVKLPESLRFWLTDQGVHVYETNDLEEVAPYADIVYMTRVQKERFVNLDEYELARMGSKLTAETLKILPKDAVIMHPLPRVDEIAVEVDSDSRAAYFRQANNGLPVRMALLALVLGAK